MGFLFVEVGGLEPPSQKPYLLRTTRLFDCFSTNK